MKCVELTFNGKQLSIAGGKQVRSIDHRLYFFPPTATGSFTVAGYADGEPDGLDRLFWTHGDLRVGDELLVRVVEADKPDAGSLTPDWHETPHPETEGRPTCTFCGKTNEQPQFFMTAKTGAICGECVERAAKFMNTLGAGR